APRLASLLLLAAPGLAAAGACAPGDAPPADDPPPVILEVAAAPSLRLVEEFRVHGFSDPRDLATSPSSLAVTPAGELYAFETPDYEILCYAPDGTFLLRFGRPGTGPGEFSGPARIGVVGDTVWVIESTPPRITLFRSDGTLLSSERYAHVAFPDHSAPL